MTRDRLRGTAPQDRDRPWVQYPCTGILSPEGFRNLQEALHLVYDDIVSRGVRGSKIVLADCWGLVAATPFRNVAVAFICVSRGGPLGVEPGSMGGDGI